MKPPFDIAADLDTPVSAYLKLKPFRPRFLLESVEGGERLARYSFIGFGDCLEVRLDAAGLAVGGVRSRRPQTKLELLNALRDALRQAPQPLPEVPGVPLLGGLVGYTAYDAVRYFERVTGRSLDATETPHAHYVAPRSLLVFDHLTISPAAKAALDPGVTWWGWRVPGLLEAGVILALGLVMLSIAISLVGFKPCFSSAAW